MSIRTRVSGARGELVAVPAVHYRMAFAHVVRQTMRNGETRPKAVAVELGPQAAAIIAAWIRELGPGERLPCMLGLLRRNRLIHPDHRKTCLALQERYRVPLHRVPAGELLRSCGYSPTSLICLSAVDSMIEAIRSAVELGLDVYGIDLEESATGERKQVLLEDPAILNTGFKDYVKRNAIHCAEYRDKYIDDRRERHMAGQLRFLVSKYRRVLFTGGLAHWSALQCLLQSPDPPATPPLPTSEDGRYTKVIVDPNLAICQMDVMPNYTSHYDDFRARNVSRLTFPDPMDYLQHTYYEVMKKDCGQMLDAHASLARYFVYLENLLLLRQRHAVDFVTALEAAAAIVSSEMACRLQKAMVTNAGIKWLHAEGGMNLPFLQALANERQRHLVGQCNIVRLVQGEYKGEPFLVDSVIDEDLSVAHRALCTTMGPHVNNNLDGELDGKVSGEGDNDSDGCNQAGYGWIWPPCEAVFYGTAYRLASETSYRLRARDSEPFNGSLQAGIDVKATLRAFARGNPEVHVRSRRRMREPAHVELQQPFVYVLQSPQPHRSQSMLNWYPSHAGYLCSDDFVGPTAAHFSQIAKQFGDKFIGSVIYAEHRLPHEAEECRNIFGQRLIWGAVAYGNPGLTTRQAAQWITETDFRCCPVIESTSMGKLLEYFEREFRVSLDTNNWPETLVRLAIPFAKQRVLIIAPSRNLITHQAQLEARRRGICLDFVSLSYLSAPLVREIQTQWLAKSIDKDGTEWPDDVIRLLGRPDAHFNLLPPSIRQQAFPNG